MNLIRHHMLKKIGKYDIDGKPHNMVLTNYEGKMGSTLGVIQVELTVGTVTRSTMFMIVETKANYNLLLGKEWIHGVRVVPSLMHQRIIIWRPDGIVENIVADQEYFKTPINHTDRCQFNKHWPIYLLMIQPILHSPLMTTLIIPCHCTLTMVFARTKN